MEEPKLIAAVMDSREAYERVAPFMDVKDFSPPGQFWWKAIREWYANDTSSLSVDRLAIADRAAPGNAPKQREVVSGFLSDLPASDVVSSRNVAAIALELKRHNVGMELAAAIAAGDEKKQGILVPLFADLRAATALGEKRGAAVSYRWATSIDELYLRVGDENRVPLAPSRLNSRISGGALPSTHILLFARPDMGKSTFCLNFAVRLAKAGKRILYISNEDDVDKLKQRAVARAVDMTTSESTNERRVEAQRAWRDQGYEERVRFLDLRHAGVDALRKPIEEVEPQILILDQIRNLEGDGELVQKLDENGQRVREMLNEYSLIGLSVAQAGGSAEGRQVLDMNDLDSSKTGLPACADLMIGMGADETTKTRGLRLLSICKNKLSSDPISREGLLVEMDLSRVRVK